MFLTSLSCMKKKNMKLQTYILKCNDCDKKRIFWHGKTDGNLIEMICNTALSFVLWMKGCSFLALIPSMICKVSYYKFLSRMSYYCIAFARSHQGIVPHDSTILVGFMASSWCLPPSNEWMNIILKKPFTMKVQEFDTHLQVLNHILALFWHSREDRNFTDSELKAIFFSTMPLVATNLQLQGNKNSRHFQGIGCPLHNILIHSWYK